MKFLKESKKGILFIIGLIGVNSILWLSATPEISQPIESTVAQLMGATILLGFTLVFFLSTKNRLVDWLFGGLENVYFTHRWLAMLSLGFVFVHGQTTNLIIQYYRDVPFSAADAGPWARNLFIALIILALLAKYMNYEHWRIIHRLMVVPYVLAFYHAVFISSYNLLSFTPLGVWTMATGIIGVGSSVYMIVLYRKTAFKHQGVVTAKTILAGSVTEMEIDLGKAFDFKTGQFAFIKINKAPFKGVPHPFSISGGKDTKIYFTIKALGDYTQDLKNHLDVGDHVKVSRAFGHMTFDDYPSPQVWIAGGIGITPFLSHIRHMDPPRQKITLYYSVKQKDEAVHLDLFRQMDRKYDNFNFVFYQSDTDGYLSVKDLDLNDAPHVMMCGPVPMAKALKKQFASIDEHRALTYEAFSLTGTLVEDGMRNIKRIMRRLRPKRSH